MTEGVGYIGCTAGHLGPCAPQIIQAVKIRKPDRLIFPLGTRLRAEDVSRVGAGANHSEEHRVGTAVLAEPVTVPLVQEELGGFVSVFQLQHEKAMNTHICSPVLTSWYAVRQDAVSQSHQVGRPRYGEGGQTDAGGWRNGAWGQSMVPLQERYDQLRATSDCGMCHHADDQVDERTWGLSRQSRPVASVVVISKHSIANRMVCQDPRSVTGLGEQVPGLRASAWMPGSRRESRALVSRSYEPCYGREEGSRISMMKS